jgi:hypothetical protein
LTPAIPPGDTGLVTRRRRITAIVALVAAASPWLIASLAAVHLEQHADRDHDHAREVAAAVHGHEHEAGTPEHQHLWTLPNGALAPDKLLTPLPATPTRVADRVAFAAAGVVAGARAAGHDPPRRSVSILRI